MSSEAGFARALDAHGLAPLARAGVTTLQVNVGKLCDLACHHCHVEAGPKRTERMDRRTAERVLHLLRRNPQLEELDLTGGAPELNENFRFLVAGARALRRRIVDRCNLTVFFVPGQEETPEFLARQGVRVVASLPCYTPDNVDRQRGRSVFERSIEALRWLNRLGYAQPGSELALDLVYNPLDATLPPGQRELEERYRKELGERFGIAFDRLITITNMPIKRFAHALKRQGRHEAYLSLLVNHFNPATVPRLMCRSLLSVGWDGRLYDCDFNQMLELSLGAGHRTIWELDDLSELEGAAVTTAPHCFGCTAGPGSSCGGALAVSVPEAPPSPGRRAPANW